MRVSWPSLLAMAGLWLVAFLAAVPLLGAPVYWDESVHYETARYGTPANDDFTDLWGNSLNSPAALFWQRPAWYAAFWLPAQGDLETLRTAHAAVAAGLAPLAFAVLRTFGFRRVTGAAAGLAVAVMPPLPTWAAFVFMDPMMAEALALAVIYRRRGNWPISAAWAVVAVWMKETAFVLAALYAALEVLRGWIRGTASLWPLRLERREASAVFAALLSPVPLAYGMMQDVPLPGGGAYHPTAEIADVVWGSLWLAIPLALGLLWRRSRALAALGLGTGLFFIVLQALGRSTESWYLVPSLLFGVIGAAAAVESAWESAWPRGPTLRVVAVLLAAGALIVPGAVALVPADRDRDVLFPLAGVGPLPLRETYRIETEVRDQDHVAAMAALPLEDAPSVLLVAPPWPPPYVLLADAGHVYLDLAWVRAIMGFDAEPLAWRIEDNTTWTILYGPDVHPMQKAVREVYGDCIEGEYGAITVLRGAACPGRAAALIEANHRHGGP